MAFSFNSVTSEKKPTFILVLKQMFMGKDGSVMRTEEEGKLRKEMKYYLAAFNAAHGQGSVACIPLTSPCPDIP